MHEDAVRVRGDGPVVLLSLREDPTAAPVVDWVRSRLQPPYARQE